jgi:hypothetical protein
MGELILDTADLGKNSAERWVDRLERELGATWTAIRKARTTTNQRCVNLRLAFEEKIAPDTSLVLFGSIAGKR